MVPMGKLRVAPPLTTRDALSTFVNPLSVSVPPVNVNVPAIVVIWLEGNVAVLSSVRLTPLSIVRLVSSSMPPPVAVSEMPSVLERLVRLVSLTSPPFVALTFQPPCWVTVVSADTSRTLPPAPPAPRTRR